MRRYMSHCRKPGKIRGLRYKKLSLGDKAGLKTVLTILTKLASFRRVFLFRRLRCPLSTLRYNAPISTR
ncbi:hypothetical protein EMIT0P265_50022 [Pseudomonas zeae]